jgi:hypothetical protein
MATILTLTVLFLIGFIGWLILTLFSAATIINAYLIVALLCFGLWLSFGKLSYLRPLRSILQAALISILWLPLVILITLVTVLVFSSDTSTEEEEG